MAFSLHRLRQWRTRAPLEAKKGAVLKGYFDEIYRQTIEVTLDRGRVDLAYFRRKFPVAAPFWRPILSRAKKDGRVRVVGKLLVRAGMRFDGRKHSSSTSTVLALNDNETALFLLLIRLRPARLQSLLGATALGPFEAIVRTRRASEPMTLGDLAAAVVIKHGPDILSDRECRRALAESKGLETPNHWVAGTATAHEFTRRLGLPPEYAGARRRHAEEAFYEIEAIPEIPPLRPFQVDVVGKIGQFLASDSMKRALLCMPTGSGKTRVSLEGIKQYIAQNFVPSRPLLIVWMAQKEELLEQAADSLQAVWSSSSGLPPLSVLKNYSTYRSGAETRWHEVRDAVLSGPAIIFTTPQSFNNLVKEDLLECQN